MKSNEMIGSASPHVLLSLPYTENALSPDNLRKYDWLPLRQASQGICR